MATLALDTDTLDQLGPWVVVLDAEGRLVHGNPQFWAAAGREPEDQLGKGFWELFELGTESPTFQRVFADLRAQNFPNAHEALIPVSDGRRLPTRWVNSAITDEQGAIVRIIGVGFPENQDGPEHPTDAAQESLLRFGALARNATDPITELDESGRMIYVSPNHQLVLGVPPEELLGLSPLHRAHDDDRTEAEEFLAALAEGRAARLGSVRMRHADGSWVWLDVSGTPYDGVDGKRRSICVARDITRRRRAERSVADFGRILEESLNEIYAFDAETLHFTRVNRGGCENLGYSMDELRAMTPVDIKPDVDREAFDALVEPLRSRRVERLEFEAVHQRKDGTLYPVEVHLQRSELDDRPQFVAIALDLTDRKAAEERARAAEERAREAEHLASIGSLAAGLAHDIGTPMNVILGYAEMMQRSLGDDRNRHRAGIIGDQVRRVSQLVQTLLHLARPEAARPVRVDLARIIDESLDFLGENLRRRAIELERSYEQTPPITGDPGQLQQVLVNLFVNAADAMPDGGKLAVHLCPVGNDEVEVCVKDTGCGIPRQDVSRIFEPFFTTKEKGKGTGLGLLVTKRIVFDHGGRIDVTSDEGEGTEFRVRLPLCPPAPAGD
ncbi:MAG: PAS domain-containing sensor histidine kinase [Myxococcota bacterium]